MISEQVEVKVKENLTKIMKMKQLQKNRGPMNLFFYPKKDFEEFKRRVTRKEKH